MMKKSIVCLTFGLALSSCSMTRQSAEAPPAPIGATPTQAQLDWHRLETYAFIHFGLNTYNDLEWGYGNTPAATFAPKVLDVEQWVTTLKRAGMKGVILTAKHHDGFCLWPTKTTDYSVKNSPWKGGQGDLVKDLSEACRKHGLKFGLYLSPWDRNNKHYGFEEYRRIFHEQIRELTTGYGQLFEYWFDGANGGTGWYGGADTSRSINPKTYYGYHDAGELLRANNPNIMIFGGTEPTIRWIGNERGWAGQTNYSTYDADKEKHHSANQWGMRDGKQWLPGEVDVSIRPGWFYHHREDHQVRSVANLTNIYYESVGRNANLLLNFPVNLDGKIPATDSTNVIAWHEHIKRTFANNIAKGAHVEAKDTRRGKTFVPKHLVDGKDTTYWATTDGVHTAEVTLRLPRRSAVNNLLLQEYIALGQRVDAFEVETLDASGAWKAVATSDSLTTIGYKRIIRFNTVDADAIRVRVTKARGPVCLAEIGAYLAPELIEAPMARRNAADMLEARATGPGQQLRYRVGSGAWQPYTQPVHIPGDLLTIEVEARSSRGTQSAVTKLPLGYSAKGIKAPALSEKDFDRLFDGNGYSAITLPNKARELNLEFTSERAIRKLVYTPNQGRDASGHIQRYELYLDGKRVAVGEFSNIRNNPIPVEIILPQAIKAKSLRLVVTKTVEDRPYVSIGDLELF